jgi:trehalose 6-phosphate phosphatase
MAQPLTSIEPLLPLLRRQPFGVLADIDGTLAPIVPRPEDAAVPEETRELLRGLTGRGVRVALITGRSLEAARSIAGLSEVAYAAGHGLTLWIEGRTEVAPGLEPYPELARRAEHDLGPLASRIPGVQFENKGPLLAVHYRRTAEPEAAREAILAELQRSPVTERFWVQEGRFLIELRPPIGVDKGTAAVALAGRLGLRGAIVLGDDMTDIDMFAALGGKKVAGLTAATIAVVNEEATPEVLRAADYSLEGTEGVRWLLAEVLRALP